MSANNTSAIIREVGTYWTSRNIFVDVLAVIIFFVNLILVTVLLKSPRCRKQVRRCRSVSQPGVFGMPVRCSILLPSMISLTTKKVAYISRVSYRLSVSERECLVYTICNLRNCEIEYLMSFMTWVASIIRLDWLTLRRTLTWTIKR